jgi:hypothetical protein
MLRRRLAVIEGAAFVVAAVVATVYAERQILFTTHAYQNDALLLEYWMRRFQNPQLFTDPLTHALTQTAYVPFGVQGLYLLASYVIDPIRFGAWGAVVLAPFSGWLVFRIIREHTAWIPAAWLGGALFLLPSSMERFSGTHARAFAQPIVLLTLYLVLRGRIRWAAAVPPVGALLYPPAALLAGGVLAGAALGRHGRRPAVGRGGGGRASGASSCRPADERPDQRLGSPSLSRVRFPRADGLLPEVRLADAERALLGL